MNVSTVISDKEMSFLLNLEPSNAIGQNTALPVRPPIEYLDECNPCK